MKLLFDQNLSFRLVAKLANEFPNSAHLRFYILDVTGISVGGAAGPVGSYTFRVVMK
jgi:predicted nuclease of predicted toxin-antitoxin system